VQEYLLNFKHDMSDLLSYFNSDAFFWFCALSGTVLFIIQFALTLLGAADHNELVDDTSGADAGNFKWMSKQAITGFLMMFGWVALTCQKQFGLQGASTIAIAFAGGLVTVLITGWIFKTAKKFHSPGNVFKIEDTLGKEATVYQRIPAGGAGKISVTLNDLTHEIDAITHEPLDLPSFTRVQIIKKADDKTVVVTAR